MWSIRICRRWLASHTTSHACLLIGRLGIIAFLLHPSASLAGTFTTFGETFQRATGSPATATRTFSVPNPATTYSLRLDNGGSSRPFFSGARVNVRPERAAAPPASGHHL